MGKRGPVKQIEKGKELIYKNIGKLVELSDGVIVKVLRMRDAQVVVQLGKTTFTVPFLQEVRVINMENNKNHAMSSLQLPSKRRRSNPKE